MTLFTLRDCRSDLPEEDQQALSPRADVLQWQRVDHNQAELVAVLEMNLSGADRQILVERAVNGRAQLDQKLRARQLEDVQGCRAGAGIQIGAQLASKLLHL